MRVDWIECELGDLLKLKNGFAFQATNYKKEGIPVFRIGDINDWIVSAKNSVKIEEKEVYDEYIVEPGDILIAMSGATTGKFGIYHSTEKAYQNQRVGNLKLYSENSINKSFVFYLLYSLKRDIERDAYGGAQPNISGIKIEALKTKLAPQPIQRAIVSKIEALFSDLDNGIANFKKAQDQLKVYRQAVLKKSFEGELTAAWREKQTNLPTAEELLKKIKEERQNHYNLQIENWKKAVKVWEKNEKESQRPIKPKKLAELPLLKDDVFSKLPLIPKNWIYNYMAYAGELGRGKSKHRPRNDKRLFGGNYPFFQTGDVKAQKLIRTYSQTYNEFGLKQSKLWKKGTLCITIAANIADTGFLGIDACFPDSIVGYNPYKNVVSERFIEYFIQSAKSKISAFAPATAQKNINLTTLENLVIPFCSLQEQIQIVQEIESRLSVCDKMEQSINESIEKAEALRQSILKKAFEGKLLSKAEIELCKKETDYEPASELLKKIQAEKLGKEQEKKKPTVKKKSKQ
jgi:type I restriction enzyme S subunit